MPIFGRSGLRQGLQQNVLNDGFVSTTTGSCGALASGAFVVDSTRADPSLSGQGLYRRAWVKVNGMELRVASFNCGSGAFLTSQIAGTVIGSGAQYEIHEMLSPSDKDKCVDWTVRRLRVRQEVAIPAVDGLTVYSLDGAASPNLIQVVLGAYRFADPTGSLGYGREDVVEYAVVATASGTNQVRISSALSQSQQLVLDSILAPSLGAADSSTLNVNVPNEQWILEGAAAKAFDLLIQQGPSQEVGQYQQRRLEHARAFSRLSQAYQPQTDRTIELDSPF